MDFDFVKKLYERLDRYVRINTQSDPDSKTFPSTKCQFDLGRLLVKEMKAIGLKKVKMDKYGYVTGELPANTKKKVPTIGFLAHMDTSDGASGKDVKPQVHKNYNGKNITISKKHNIVLSPNDSPSILGCVGDDIVTASGDTLLGADDKAGIAIILTAMEYLIKRPNLKHGMLKIGFTPDEEIGKGVNFFNVKSFGAKYAYTFDGDVIGTIEDENFNADSVLLEVFGKSYHPGKAKNVMINAVRVLADILSAWPENMLPETTEDREGFVLFNEILESNVEKSVARGIVRDHDTKKLKDKEKLLEAIVNEKRHKYPGAKINLVFKEQYRNMKNILNKHPMVMKNLYNAFKDVDVVPIYKPIRGGTDGARLSFMGLPTPNVFTGGDNFHGKYEWVSLQGMEKSAKVLVALVQQWEKNSK
jgi:tripeptide aminopeptidase